VETKTLLIAVLVAAIVLAAHLTHKYSRKSD
jgi:hypothetical protein